MAQQFAGSRMDRASGIVMLVATALALLVGFAVGPPSGEAITIGFLLLLGFVVVFFSTWVVRLCRVGRIARDESELIAPRFEPAIRLFLTLWLGLAGASMILLIAGLVSLPTGIATSAVVSAFLYLVAVWMLSRSIVGTLVNLAILWSATPKDSTASD